jgi:ribosomal protein S18 acetylase RimI-like enzyme
MRLEHLPAAVDAGSAYILVADDGGTAIGWIVVHTAYRDDQDWEPDADTQRFQRDENAYVENIEVTARVRSSGIGKKLIEAAQDEARKRGKRCLWLHTRENNAMAHKLFEREGWELETNVYPEWRPGERWRIYKKTL